METKAFLQFEIITNDLVSFFQFIWIPMLCKGTMAIIYIFYSYSEGIDFRRHLQTSPHCKGYVFGENRKC